MLPYTQFFRYLVDFREKNQSVRIWILTIFTYTYIPYRVLIRSKNNNKRTSTKCGMKSFLIISKNTIPKGYKKFKILGLLQSPLLKRIPSRNQIEMNRDTFLALHFLTLKSIFPHCGSTIKL